MAFARHITFISLYFDCFSSSLLILGDFKVTRCVLVDIITSCSVLQLRLLQTKNSARSLESKYQKLYPTKNCAAIPKIKLKYSSCSVVVVTYRLRTFPCRTFVGMVNFTFREMHVAEKSMGKS